ncbi:MAG: glycosyltransferase family 4 protein [Anaerolineae bacterium]|nr:glycosyltransferase family 4 protein [Anaerolineae bacterium]
MHICFTAIDFHTDKSGGGIASYVQALGAALVDLGVRVTVIAKGEQIERQEHGGIHILFWPFGNISWYLHRIRILGSWPILPVRELEWSYSLRKAVLYVHREHRIDIIEGCETGNLLLAQTGIPLIMRLHGEAYSFAKHSNSPIHPGLIMLRKLESIALRKTAAVTSPSQVQADEVANDLGWEKGRIAVIPNPVAPVLLEAGREYIEEKNMDGTPIVLYTGRIAHVKGILTLLQSVTMVSESNPGVRFVIAGQQHASIDNGSLNQALDTNNTRAHVTLLGHVPWDELVLWYRQATVFVMPSYYDTFGISCLEAMAFGLPVVASRAGGLPEVVEDGVTGILVPPKDPNALGTAIDHLLQNPELRRKMGEAGRNRVLRKFTADRVAEESMQIYKRVLAEEK